MPQKPNFHFNELWKSLAKWDKDTFIFGMIVTLTIVGLILRANPTYTVGTGAGAIVAYIILRYSLANIQAREREAALKSSGPRRARKVITDNASPEELERLAKMETAARSRANAAHTPKRMRK